MASRDHVEVEEGCQMLAAAHVDEHYYVTFYDELEKQGPEGLGRLLIDIIRHAHIAYGWDPDQVWEWVEEEWNHPTDTPRRVTTQ